MEAQEKSKSSLWKIATSIGGFIAFVATVGAWLAPDAGPALWQTLATWINSIRGGIWSIVSYSIPVPITLLIIGAIGFCWIGFKVNILLKKPKVTIRQAPRQERNLYKGVEFVIDKSRGLIEFAVCGECQAPFGGSLTHKGTEYLICQNGHFVGSEVPFEETKARIDEMTESKNQKIAQKILEAEQKFEVNHPGLLEKFDTNPDAIEEDEAHWVSNFRQALPVKHDPVYIDYDRIRRMEEILDKIQNEFIQKREQERIRSLPRRELR